MILIVNWMRRIQSYRKKILLNHLNLLLRKIIGLVFNKNQIASKCLMMEASLRIFPKILLRRLLQKIKNKNKQSPQSSQQSKLLVAIRFHSPNIISPLLSKKLTNRSNSPVSSSRFNRKSKLKLQSKWLTKQQRKSVKDRGVFKTSRLLKGNSRMRKYSKWLNSNQRLRPQLRSQSYRLHQLQKKRLLLLFLHSQERTLSAPLGWKLLQYRHLFQLLPPHHRLKRNSTSTN